MANNKNDRNIYVENDIIYGIIGCIAGALVARVWGVIIAIVITCYFIYKHLELQAKQEFYSEHPEAFFNKDKQIIQMSKEDARHEAVEWAKLMCANCKRLAVREIKYSPKMSRFYIYTYDYNVIEVFWCNSYHILVHDDINHENEYVFRYLNDVLRIASDFDKAYFVTTPKSHTDEINKKLYEETNNPTWLPTEYWLIRRKSGTYHMILSKRLAKEINEKFGSDYIADDADNRAKGATESL